ncbi:hypothetical protein D3C84_670360 [compost metagenome]
MRTGIGAGDRITQLGHHSPRDQERHLPLYSGRSERRYADHPRAQYRAVSQLARRSRPPVCRQASAGSRGCAVARPAGNIFIGAQGE